MEAATIPRDGVSRRRPLLLAAGVGLAVGLCVVAIGFSIVAIPLYMLARLEPGNGLDRPVVHNGLFYVALPLGAVLGAAAAGVVGVWYARGGRLPDGRSDGLGGHAG
jgi:hypothetical protein